MLFAYLCVCNDGGGVHVMIDEAVSNEGTVPKFTTELVTQEVLIGQPVTMSCDVIGTPTPEVTWYQVRNFCGFSVKSV